MLINLGTPDAPERSAVRRYLSEFLMDGRVIDITAPLRALLVLGVIAPLRAGRSARQYQAIWDAGDISGSPLMHHSLALRRVLQDRLGDDLPCHLAMRYGSPSMHEVLGQLREEGIERLLVLPLYPQYASATSGSVGEKLMRILAGWDNIPTLHFVHDLLHSPGFIEAWRAEVLPIWGTGKWDHLLFSFHGLPERQVRRSCGRPCMPGDCPVDSVPFCYRSGCSVTARGIAQTLLLPDSAWSISYQSRLGSGWLRPYSDAVVAELARSGVRRLLVCAAAFTADCLETVYEVEVELRETFMDAGGESFALVPSLNAGEAWVDVLEDIVREQLSAPDQGASPASI
ncbi:MAG: ferrochelatase [Gammaproteobacteria bacterium AqS3]|nr:ferrochelatase [Gammaproteobacteria bacterium AqS3]